jgi:hypothetical protein
MDDLRVLLAPHQLISEAHLVVGAEIGKGSFGMVQRGEYAGQPVCIKVRLSPPHLRFRRFGASWRRFQPILNACVCSLAYAACFPAYGVRGCVKVSFPVEWLNLKCRFCRFRCLLP